MTCTEFQEVLPEIIDWNSSSDAQTHLDSCRDCINLVSDQVAAAAKFVLSLEELPPRVWHNIRRRLEDHALEPASHKADWRP